MGVVAPEVSCSIPSALSVARGRAWASRILPPPRVSLGKPNLPTVRCLLSLHVFARPYPALRWDLGWEEPLDFPALLLNTPGKRSPGLVMPPAPPLPLNNGSHSSDA